MAGSIIIIDITVVGGTASQTQIEDSSGIKCIFDTLTNANYASLYIGTTEVRITPYQGNKVATAVYCRGTGTSARSIKLCPNVSYYTFSDVEINTIFVYCVPKSYKESFAIFSE